MIKYLLFDLDRTLWDFEGNADITFGKMYETFRLEQHTGVDCETFHDFYRIVNDQLWEQYRNGTLLKEVLNLQRFVIPLRHFGMKEGVIALSEKLGDFYVHEGPKQTGLMPGTRHLLEYLQQKGCYSLCIITNGFKEAQVPKMHSSDIHRYFSHFFLSEELEFMKPDVRFFEAVLKKLNAKPEECLVIGDDYKVDIQGAHNASIPQIFYNLDGKYKGDYPFQPTWEVHSLAEIEGIL